MTEYIEFSYPIDPSKPILEEGFRSPVVEVRSRISQGRHSNTSYIDMFAHTGTHIDAPWHFVDNAYKIEDFPIESFVFSRVLLVEIPAQSRQSIPVESMLPYEPELKETDCLLIYSGFSRNRTENKEEYIEATPGLSIELAEYLSHYPKLICVGVDFISIENVDNGRKTGFPVHHALLGGETQRILLEDADLSRLRGKDVARVYLFPLRVIGLEASPVTAVAELA